MRLNQRFYLIRVGLFALLGALASSYMGIFSSSLDESAPSCKSSTVGWIMHSGGPNATAIFFLLVSCRQIVICWGRHAIISLWNNFNDITGDEDSRFWNFFCPYWHDIRQPMNWCDCWHELLSKRSNQDSFWDSDKCGRTPVRLFLSIGFFLSFRRS